MITDTKTVTQRPQYTEDLARQARADACAALAQLATLRAGYTSERARLVSAGQADIAEYCFPARLFLGLDEQEKTLRSVITVYDAIINRYAQREG